ncbi:hypothetical protein PF005_g23011 [Phytophthora fragariae]|uniref:Amino acid permease/ SLC12A domain-containing protein n=1 Tax=Phytophthora fragariae TaxID=53985 RepID=A0A6A3ULX7_9STRA|nr:hypothetical protein PF003_g13729 [Phytophthora fragariae]KAE8939131.1 hypothetical protein PF009_g11021 [Phytophthora fragariae]KAE9064513.1 hypothetical protein PF007_g29171 [Phytophthora fragariae]KAE9148052.1 hypothetical protein PF006_g7326 [Phytophthora fragariae]KAE9181091.1 hypothetical protein PF005_g23011 [Phytophthora fragariae]
MTHRDNRAPLRLELLPSGTPLSQTPFTANYAHVDGITPLSVRKPTETEGAGWASEMNFIRADTPSQLRQRFIQIQVVHQRFKEPTWVHPNIGGEAQYVQGPVDEIAAIHEELEAHETKNKLGEWTATSIGGNDIMSSVLFSTGQTIAKAGKLAPVAQVLVAIVIYCLRWVFEEVMSAVPLNGGFYTAMLNSSPKKVGAVCAVFSILSYLATGVVNRVSAMNYVNESLVELPVMACSIGLLAVFALLCLMGIAESAFVALLLFSFHMFTLILLGVFSIVYIAQHPSIFVDNMHTSLPEVTMFGSALQGANVFSALFLGYVLTAYVGINGLFQRLAIDRVLPSFLLKTNSWRGTNHFIIVAFFIVASSLVFILDAEVTVLSGVFALAFLCVLMCFIVACLLLKVGREQISREKITSWTNTSFCFCTVTLGILANAFSDLRALSYFFIYFAVFFVVVFLMLTRVSGLKAMLFVSRKLILHFRGDRTSVEQRSALDQAFVGSVMIAKAIETIKNTPVVFFCKTANLPKINEAVSYVMRNEHTYCLRLVHVCEPDAPVPREFEDVVNLFDHIYPSTKIDFIAVTGAFDPAMVQWLSKSMAIPTNMMLMGQPSSKKTHRVSVLGVRIVTE